MKKLSIIAFLITLFVGIASAEVPPVIPNTYVQDHANVLTPEDEANIQNQLNQLKIKYNLEFAVATVTTTEPRVIADYSLEMARTYGIGAKDGEKRGILLLLAIKDRKWRFEISRHMEGVLTDGQSGSIGRNVLVPALKKAKDSTGYRDAILLTLSATEAQFVKNIQPEQQTPIVGTSDTDSGGGGGTALVVLGTLGGLGALGGGGYGLYAWRRRRREEEEERLAEEERARLRAERLAKEKAEREAHEAWLKTPEGIAETARLAKLEAERVERQRKIDEENRRIRAEEERRHQAWLKTPEGKADTARRLAEKKAREEREAREREEQRKRDEARRKRQREEDEERERRRREESYSSSYSSSSSSSSSSSWGSSSSSSGFGGGGDFGGGGSDGSW